ncbi:hypothetical protein MGL_1208 [Malassezia globosa CBS 7966]|uniref:NADH-ubiquinone oxidoreductase 9.5 kDa subunit n=1 Tax=Malassezia globosa (strain ATCC MYA-4612 / CBS 7966) TaxID=425265 RepID=A8PWT2_MALGO|nr:uncharacterized protein MGL_1208 [Malassezia globosa CBS 7966]EDP44726.1 hypothetical protein MGL_1208 [Malassezia globosa CBS 7966]
MAFMSTLTRPFVNTLKYLQWASHARPVVFYSLLLGALGPVSVVVVPKYRAQFGWKPAERIPVSYPLPDRPRSPVSGYDDE